MSDGKAAGPGAGAGRAGKAGGTAQVAGGGTIEVGGRQLAVSNLDKVFWPETGTTKGEVLDYYARIAPVLVPHLAGRAVTRKRYPDGVGGPFFFERVQLF